MRILIFDERQGEREAMRRAFEIASHDVAVGADPKCPLLAMKENAPDAVIVAYQGKTQLETLRTISQSYPACYLIAAIESGVEVPLVMAAGAKEIVRRPLLVEELLARVQAPQRLGRYAAEAFDVQALASWQNLKNVIAHDLAQTIGCPLHFKSKHQDPDTWRVRAGSISMSLTQHQLELRVTVVADNQALAWLAGTLLGDANATAESLSDMLRELANVAAGAVKRSMASERLVVVTGAPTNDVPVSIDPASSLAGTLTEPGFFAWVVETKRRKNLRVSASKLAEGMVLVSDLRNEAGTLLAPAGTRLTSSAAERVRMILGERFVVEISEAA
jgi:DNA-binding response OmpR family regulator